MVKALVVYSVGQSRVRRIIVPDPGENVEKYLGGIVDGEAEMLMDVPNGAARLRSAEHVSMVEAAHAKISAITGKPTEDDRYVVVDGNLDVVGGGCFDPAIDVVEVPPKTKLMKHADAVAQKNYKAALKFAEKVGVPKAKIYKARADKDKPKE